MLTVKSTTASPVAAAAEAASSDGSEVVLHRLVTIAAATPATAPEAARSLA